MEESEPTAVCAALNRAGKLPISLPTTTPRGYHRGAMPWVAENEKLQPCQATP